MSPAPQLRCCLCPSRHGCAGDASDPASRKIWKILPEEDGSTCEHGLPGDFYPRQQWTVTQLLLTRRKTRLWKQLHMKCLDVPRRHGSCLPPQHKALFLCLLDYKKASVFLRHHQKYSVCSNTNTGSASVLQNQIKALKAANYAMEYLKNPWKHCSSFLKCPHAGVWVRNGCFKLQYIEGAIPSNQFNFRPKYKNIPSPPGELN